MGNFALPEAHNRPANWPARAQNYYIKLEGA